MLSRRWVTKPTAAYGNVSDAVASKAGAGYNLLDESEIATVRKAQLWNSLVSVGEMSSPAVFARVVELPLGSVEA